MTGFAVTIRFLDWPKKSLLLHGAGVGRRSWERRTKMKVDIFKEIGAKEKKDKMH